MLDLAIASFAKLEKYCIREGFKGWDPYDGLNSQFFKSLPAHNNRLFRLIWIQIFKKSPFNFRKITRVDKEYNPKALGLFLSGYCAMYNTSFDKIYLDKILYFSKKILELRNSDFTGACWGYNFDWQARAFFQPKNTPTIVASVFIANALLDAYEITKEEILLNTARSTCNFILNDLNRTFDKEGNFSFSYSPLDNSVVFNASLLGSRLLSRVYSFTLEENLVQEAKKSTAFCIHHQNDDGSWSYGTLPFHQWKDSFHTGYNLECLSDYMNFSGDHSYKVQLERGFRYYLDNFFTMTGISKYYDNSTYPIDIHAPAQFIITLSKLKKLDQYQEIVDKVLKWTIINMQSKNGFFYFQINKHIVSKIPYMRWAQAWMFYALSTYINSNAAE